MAWSGGFTGQGFNRAEFREYLSKQKKPAYVRTVAHNTDAPYMVPPYGPVKRIAALKNYYQNNASTGKRAGPDFFVFGGENKVYLGTPLGFSVGCAGWNGNSLHVEAEGKYTKASKQDPLVDGSVADQVWATMAWVFAEFHEWMKMPVDDQHLKFHKEGNTTHKTCPGDLVTKEWFMTQVNKQTKTPTPQPKAADPITKWVNTPGDTLTVRAKGSPKADPVGKLPHGVKVDFYKSEKGWAKVRSPAGYLGWVNEKYLSNKNPKAQAPTPPKPPVKPNVPEKEDRPKKAVDYYMAQGLPKYKAAAIVGRLQRESFPDLRTDVWGDNHSAYGVGQWREHRLENLKKFAALQNKPISDLETQLAFVLWEFSHVAEADIGKLHAEAMNKATTLVEACEAMMHYERPKGYQKDAPRKGDGWDATVAFATALLK